MKIIFHGNFDKRYKKLRKNEQRQTKERLELFLHDEFNPILNNHPLKGKYKNYRSINITGNLRALYKLHDADVRIFVVVDTHSNLYKLG